MTRISLKNVTYIVCFCNFFDSRTLCRDEFVAAFVYHTDANLALIALFAQAPNKITAMGAEGGLTEKSCHEFVGVDLVNASFHRTATLFDGKTACVFLKLPDWLLGFFLSCPHEFYFYMD